MARVSLSATGYYKTPDIVWDRIKGQGRPFFYFAHGAAVTEVLLDPLTGENRITRTDILHDAGASLNPALDIGQVEGGYVQGAGWLTTEELVWEATQIARDMLTAGTQGFERSFPLGPDLGQCCGGAVVLQFSAMASTPVVLDTKLWIWGAGHVGRALVSVIAPLDLCEITWADTDKHRFPSDLPAHVNPLVAADLARAAQHAPPDAHHLIMTYSHAFDLALCSALLRHGFGSAGLIGSETKWARFRKRLRALGHTDAEIARITCPIGDISLGKHPQAIAVGIAAQLLSTGAPARRPQEHTL